MLGGFRESRGERKEGGREGRGREGGREGWREGGREREKEERGNLLVRDVGDSSRQHLKNRV